MKRIIFASIILGAVSLNLRVLSAAVKGTSGVGLIVGSTTGINVKHFLWRRGPAVEGDFSVVSGRIYLTASYLWHDFLAFPEIEEGELPLFYGISAAILGNVPAFGVVMGASYLFKDYPFDVFIKLSPLIVFEKEMTFKEMTFTFIGGIGVRYFFR